MFLLTAVSTLDEVHTIKLVRSFTSAKETALRLSSDFAVSFVILQGPERYTGYFVDGQETQDDLLSDSRNASTKTA